MFQSFTRGLLIVASLAMAAPAMSDTRPATQIGQNAEGAINTLRRSSGLRGLRRSTRLDRAARDHAADMARRGFFSHHGSDGSTHTKRIQRRGCGGGAENIASGRFTETSVATAWIGSPGHRRNILLPAVTHYGLANVGDKWVMTLSRNCP